VSDKKSFRNLAISGIFHDSWIGKNARNKLKIFGIEHVDLPILQTAIHQNQSGSLLR
jgi:hypothetical protein